MMRSCVRLQYRLVLSEMIKKCVVVEAGTHAIVRSFDDATDRIHLHRSAIQISTLYPRASALPRLEVIRDILLTFNDGFKMPNSFSSRNLCRTTHCFASSDQLPPSVIIATFTTDES